MSAHREEAASEEGGQPPDEQTRAITLGHPSYVWGFGQERRLNWIRQSVPLEERSILDVGCGIGTYVRAFRRFSPAVYGVDIDASKIEQVSEELPGFCIAPAERLPFQSGCFHVVLSHEVIEHVADDRQALAEAVRVLRQPEGRSSAGAGRLVVFAPNRLYPFETHGVFWRGRYRSGNIPLVNYLPTMLRNRFCPHVRAYTRHSLRRLFAGLPVRLVLHTQIFPGFDKVAGRNPAWGRFLRRLTYFLERTPLRCFGLSHLLVVEKVSPETTRQE